MLRKMVEKDVSIIYTMRNHPDVRLNMFQSEPITQSQHAKWFAANNNSEKHMLIYEHEEKVLGFASLAPMYSETTAEWGFYTAPESPKGTGTQLGKETLDYAFEHSSLHKIFAQVIAFNQASIALHKKLGFSQEGVLKEHHYHADQYHDVVCFGLLKHQWQEIRGNIKC